METMGLLDILDRAQSEGWDLRTPHYEGCDQMELAIYEARRRLVRETLNELVERVQAGGSEQ